MVGISRECHAVKEESLWEWVGCSGLRCGLVGHLSTLPPIGTGIPDYCHTAILGYRNDRPLSSYKEGSFVGQGRHYCPSTQLFTRQTLGGYRCRHRGKMKDKDSLCPYAPLHLYMSVRVCCVTGSWLKGGLLLNTPSGSPRVENEGSPALDSV